MFGWLSKKNKESKNFRSNFSDLKVDIHSHLIPNIDDGSSKMEETILIIQKLVSLGFRKSITTPHIMTDMYKNTNENIMSGLEKVKQELIKEKITYDLEAAAEYYIDYDFERKIDKENFLTFGDNYILTELSFMDPPIKLFDIIFKLQVKGYKVVLAHPERYSYFTMNDFKELVSRGVFMQVNALSLVGYYSKNVQQTSEKLIQNDLVSFLGTDCHNLYQAGLYEKCMQNKYINYLLDSDSLLNSTLL